MNVRELIEELQKCNPDALVKLQTSGVTKFAASFVTPVHVDKDGYESSIYLDVEPAL